MKKYVSGLTAILLALAASAFTSPEPTTKAANQTQYHWFDAETGIYLGLRTIDAQESQCPGAGEDCANAYTSKTANNQPAGSFVTTVQRLP